MRAKALMRSLFCFLESPYKLSLEPNQHYSSKFLDTFNLRLTVAAILPLFGFILSGED
jgi:hypothetical protein